MTDYIIQTTQPPQPSWYHWSKTNTQLALFYEHKLLSRVLNLKAFGNSISNDVSPVKCLVDVPKQTIPEIPKTIEKHDLPESSIEQVAIGDTDFINTLILNTSPNTHQQIKHQPKNVVICHGYGAGLGFFYKNYQHLSTIKDSNVLAIDWLGMGNSSRPRFKTSNKNDSVTETEDFFVNSLEKWRIKMGLDKMILVGHSMGGYLSSCYAFKYPQNVDKLILVSPAGVPSKPSNLPEPTSYTFRLFRSLWSWNVTPMAIIRSFGPYGQRLVESYTSRRFKHLGLDEIKDLENYVYHISAQPGSGEYALSRLLLPGAWARQPLSNRLPKLTIPISFLCNYNIYLDGDIDWMNHEHALKVAPDIPGKVNVGVVKQSGHHLYLDNPDAFNYALEMEIRGVEGVHDDVVYPYRH